MSNSPRVIYAYWFRDGSVYIGQTCRPNDRRTTHTKAGPCFRMIKRGQLKYIQYSRRSYRRKAALVAEARVIRFFRHLGLNVLNNNTNWVSKELCAIEAKKYRLRRTFKASASGAYKSASQNGWLNEICQHMARPQLRHGYWTKPRCAAEAKRFRSRSDFQKNGSNAYTAAYRRGWIDEICTHMPRQLKPYQKAVFLK